MEPGRVSGRGERERTGARGARSDRGDSVEGAERWGAGPGAGEGEGEALKMEDGDGAVPDRSGVSGASGASGDRGDAGRRDGVVRVARGEAGK